jgi:hypothetical protein
MTERLSFILLAVKHIGLRIIPFNSYSKDVIGGHEQNGTICLMNIPSQHA